MQYIKLIVVMLILVVIGHLREGRTRPESLQPGGMVSVADQARENTFDPVDVQAQQVATIGQVESINLHLSYEDASTWHQTIHYPDASFIKVHLAQIDLADGDTVTVSDAAGAEQYTYPDSDFTSDGEAGFWAMSITGDTAVITLHVATPGEDEGTQAYGGVTVDRYTRGFPGLEPHAPDIAGCSPLITFYEDVACFESTHPAAVEHSRAVALIIYDNGTSTCTGWRVSPENLMFTAAHCIGDQAELDGAEIWFNYQKVACDGAAEELVTKLTGGALLSTSYHYDYTLFSVSDFAAVAGFGYLDLDPRPPAVEETIYIPQHPGGNVKHLSIEKVDSNEEPFPFCRIIAVGDTPYLPQINSTEYICETTIGSSGSPVLSADGHRVIALHVAAGLSACGKIGVRTDRLWPLVAPFFNDPVDTPESGKSFVQAAILQGSDRPANVYLGSAVAHDGDTLVVGGSGSLFHGEPGAVYVYRRSGNSWVEEAKLTATDTANSTAALFGTSVAVDRDTIVVGAPATRIGGNLQGAAYVFTRSAGAWTQQAMLTASDAAGGGFGNAVAIAGNTLFISAPGADVGTSADQGVVYIFERGGGSWSEQTILTAADGGAGDRLGSSIAVDGDTVVVGAFNAGAAYVFERSATGWSQEARLVASLADFYDFYEGFGSAVAIDGDTIVVGAVKARKINTNVSHGVAAVFTREGSAWTQQATLAATDGDHLDGFGSAVALEGDVAIIGAPGVNIGANADQGAAYIFRRDGTRWPQQQKVTALDGAANDRYGAGVALAGDAAFAGATGIDGSLGGVYVLPEADEVWRQRPRLVAEDRAPFSFFGQSVGLSGEIAIVGTIVGGNDSPGAAYLFEPGVNTWVQSQQLVASDPAAGDLFGIEVDVDGNVAIIGAPYAKVDGTSRQGAVYVFEPGVNTWFQTQKLAASDGASLDGLGGSVAIDGETIIAGAPYANVGGNEDQGAVYVFVRQGNTWAQQTKLTASDGAAGDLFGRTVAVDGDTLLVGIGGTDDRQGQAYVFVRDGSSWTQQTKMAASDGGVEDAFGSGVALDGDTAIVVAASSAHDSEGGAYVFERNGTTWTEQAKLTASDARPFSGAVTLEGGVAFVGAAADNVGGYEEQGAVYVFAGQGGNWSQQTKITASDGGPSDQFGAALALDNNIAFISAPGVDETDNSLRENLGAVYVFEREEQTQIVFIPAVLK